MHAAAACATDAALVSTQGSSIVDELVCALAAGGDRGIVHAASRQLEHIVEAHPAEAAALAEAVVAAARNDDWQLWHVSCVLVRTLSVVDVDGTNWPRLCDALGALARVALAGCAGRACGAARVGLEGTCRTLRLACRRARAAGHGDRCPVAARDICMRALGVQGVDCAFACGVTWKKVLGVAWALSECGGEAERERGATGAWDDVAAALLVAGAHGPPFGRCTALRGSAALPRALCRRWLLLVLRARARFPHESAEASEAVSRALEMCVAVGGDVASLFADDDASFLDLLAVPRAPAAADALSTASLIEALCVRAGPQGAADLFVEWLLDARGHGFMAALLAYVRHGVPEGPSRERHWANHPASRAALARLCAVLERSAASGAIPYNVRPLVRRLHGAVG